MLWVWLSQPSHLQQLRNRNLEDLKSKMGENVRIIKIDVDKNPAIAAQYRIQGVPTLMVFKQGQSKWRQSGVLSAAALQKVITSVN